MGSEKKERTAKELLFWTLGIGALGIVFTFIEQTVADLLFLVVIVLGVMFIMRWSRRKSLN